MPPEPADLLIEARWVLPIAPVNTVLRDHAVAVEAGRILAVGPTAEMNARFEPRERVIRAQHALLPGFVNSHTRAATTLMRGLAVQGPRSRWLREMALPAERRYVSPDFVRDGTQLAIAEMLRAGVTSFADTSALPEDAARAAASARIRAAIGLPVTERPDTWADNATSHLAKAERLWDEYLSDPWVSFYFAPHDTARIGNETLSRVRRVADELDARVALEANETSTAVHESLSLHGRRPLQRLEELGLLRPGSAAIHMTQLDAEDLDIITRTGICVIACVQSNLRLGSGVCPVQRLGNQQVAVGFGTADAVTAGALDILAEARAAVLVSNGGFAATDEVGRGLSAADALRMATLEGATALGMAARTGSIEPNKAADLICIDLSALSCQRPWAGGTVSAIGQPAATERLAASQSPSPETVERLADAIVFGATRAQVSDVWTSGRPAVAGGQLLAFDEERLIAVAREWSERLRTGGES